MKKITSKDLYQYHFLSEVNASPDGKRVLFTKSQADEKNNGYCSRIYCLDVATGKTKSVTATGKEKSALWLDENTILFTSVGTSEVGKTTYRKLDLRGGESVEAFTIPQKVSSIKQLNETKYVIVVSKKIVDESLNEEFAAEEMKDFVIFDEIPFWANGQGVRNKIRNTVMIYDVQTQELKEISDKYQNVTGMTTSQDGSKILYWGPTYTDKMPVHSEIKEYHVGSGYCQTLLPAGELSVNFARYFNGEVLFEGSDKKDNSSENPTLYQIDRDGAINELIYLDGALGSSSGSDMAYGGGLNLKVVGEHLYCLFTSWGNSYLSKLNDSGILTYVNEVVGSIQCFDIIGDVAYCVAMRNYEAQELYKIHLASGTEEKLTSFHETFLKGHSVVVPERFVFTNKDGYELEGWVIKPLNYEEGKTYPGILSMHGGPKGAFGTNYHHEMQCMANRDMFVFYTNPRGSSGRGEEFSRLVGQLGKIDYEDFMEFTDEVLKRYPALDEHRLGICGGSYGGFMCNWMIGHTTRFKAAASQRSISNYFTKCLTTDIGYYHNLSQVDATPWVNSEKMWDHSPLKYVEQVVTPTLFIQSDEDYRCWMSEPLQMFTNMRQRGIPSKIALFHGENHELSRAGKPHNRVNRIEEICNWLEKYTLCK